MTHSKVCMVTGMFVLKVWMEDNLHLHLLLSLITANVDTCLKWGGGKRIKCSPAVFLSIMLHSFHYPTSLPQVIVK